MLKTKTPRKTQKGSNQLKNKEIINIKISAKGVPVFTFSLPWGAPHPLSPVSKARDNMAMLTATNPIKKILSTST